MSSTAASTRERSAAGGGVEAAIASAAAASERSRTNVCKAEPGAAARVFKEFAKENETLVAVAVAIGGTHRGDPGAELAEHLAQGLGV